MASERIGEIFDRIHAGFRRSLKKGALLNDPAMRLIHEKLMQIDPRQLTREPVEKSRYVVIDTETTGLHAYAGDEICSISLMEMEGLTPTGLEFSSLIHPGRKIPTDSTRIHGISDADVENSPVIEEVLPEVTEFIAESVLVGHHTGFDLRFLNKTLNRELLCHLKNPWIDTMLLYLATTGRVGHYTLEEVADFTHTEVVGRHTAHGDAITTANLFTRLVPKLIDISQPVSKLINRQYATSGF
ncbi:MAG: 3'-5' exonuclease [Gammaproteobacteria bacterium]|nr:3'-5' exonuclease [Gammaproteobacteria bacterium]